MWTLGIELMYSLPSSYGKMGGGGGGGGGGGVWLKPTLGPPPSSNTSGY